MSKFWSSGDDEGSASEASASASIEDEDEDNEGTGSGAGSKAKHTEDERDRLSLDPNAAWKEIQDEQEFQKEPRCLALSSANNKSGDYTRLVIISDTHGLHRTIHLPKGDILIHGGDFTKTGEVGTIEDLSQYFAESGFEDVVVIAGNHDVTLDPEYYQKKWRQIHRKPYDCDTAQECIERNSHYLSDTSWTSGSGLHFYGSPYSPYFFGWAFNLHRGAPIRQVWDKIPSREEVPIDVLVTHGPPLGRCDSTKENGHAGCYDLLQAIQHRIKPRVNIFGHIHEGYGTSYDGQTLFVNASSLDVKYKPVNRPIVIDISHTDKSEPARIVQPNNTHVSTQSALEQWCTDHGYNHIAAALQKYNGEELPLRNDLLKSSAYWKLLDKLDLYRSKQGQRELQNMLGKLYADCF